LRGPVPTFNFIYGKRCVPKQRGLEEAPLEEQIRPFRAALEGEGVRVTERDRYGELEESGYGTKEGKDLVLRDYEALYLLYAKKLEIEAKGGEKVTFERLAELAQKKARDSWTKFVIYRDLRSRGYIVREGFGFGTDLRVYERGDYPKKPAKYVVFALDEGIEKGMADLQKSVREMAKMGKEAIIAVIERRGEVIYYKVSRARF
jgi:tRNA-intron endonuclease, archaea type